MPADTFIIVGTLGRTRGVTGEMYVTLETDFPDRFVDLREIHVHDRNGWEIMRLASSRLVSGKPVIRFDNVTTREEAARLTGRQLGVPRDQVVRLPIDTYYLFDLIGCRVIEKDTGSSIGRLVDVEQYPANDVYVIEDESGKVMRCPAVRQYVTSVDIAGKKIMICSDGLIQEHESPTEPDDEV
ncbi:MAG: ribosome maturation factor RimM [bacterium]